MNELKTLKLSVGKINHNHVRLFWSLVTLSLLILGAGAPESSGGWVGG